MKSKKPVLIGAVAVVAVACALLILKGRESPSAGEVEITATPRDELCAEHQLPIAECFFCDSALRDPERLWCEPHERYEDRCFICHPEIKEQDRLWCQEHSLYEDECLFCHPELRAAREESEEEVKTPLPGELLCIEHGVLEKDCGICHPDLIADLQPGQGLKIRLESPESAVKAGLVTATPATGGTPARLVVLSRVSYDLNRLARITPLAAGVVQRVWADVGDSVSEGQVLVEIISPEISSAEGDYLNAVADEALKELTFRREGALLEKEITSQQEYEEAVAEYKVAKSTTTTTRQRLLNYGFTDGQIREVAEARSSPSRLLIRAPFSGTLIERDAVTGEAVEVGDMLFTLADLSSMWLELSVPEDRLALLEVGGPVEATFDALPGTTVPGRLIWVASSIDEQSRMIRARAILPNPGSSLKHGMFGQVRILPAESLTGLNVPMGAVHRFDGNPFVFVRLASDLYEIRRVALGGKERGTIEILEGVSPEEELVVAHSFTVKSEFLKSRLGAGCVHE